MDNPVLIILAIILFLLGVALVGAVMYIIGTIQGRSISQELAIGKLLDEIAMLQASLVQRGPNGHTNPMKAGL